MTPEPGSLVQDAGATPDSLRAILDSVFRAPQYQWLEPKHPFAFLERWWSAFWGWLDGVAGQHPTAYRVAFWIAVAGVTLWLVRLLWAAIQALRAGATAGEALPGAPAAERRSAAWFRREAERLWRDGQYHEAMHADFVALMLELDQRQLLQYHRSQTPQECLHHLRTSPALTGELHDLVQALYRYTFGGVPCGPDESLAWRQRAVVSHYAPAH